MAQNAMKYDPPVCVFNQKKRDVKVKGMSPWDYVKSGRNKQAPPESGVIASSDRLLSEQALREEEN